MEFRVKYKILFFLFLIFCSSQFIFGQSSEDISNYQLVWHDEFNDELIDNSKWILDNETREYTSAKLRTKGKAKWKYGKIVVRAKLPKAGKGI